LAGLCRKTRSQTGLRNWEPLRDGELGAGGLGLGLSIVAECVQALAATIHVESTPGCGTVFSLEVPMVASVQATSARPS